MPGNEKRLHRNQQATSDSAPAGGVIRRYKDDRPYCILCRTRLVARLQEAAEWNLCRACYKTVGRRAQELQQNQAGGDDPHLTLEQVHAAAAAAGAKPSRLTAKGFQFNSRVCHPGGDNPSGSWARVKDGRVTLHCRQPGCKFPLSDQQIRANLGLPAWETGYTADKPGYAGKVERKQWEYHNPFTDETATQHIAYFPPGQCPNGQHRPDRRCKHPFLQRPDQFHETPIDGFRLHFHESPGGNKTFPFLTITEGQDAADKAAEAGYPALSYIGGANNAGKADYAVCSGQRICIAPDNDPAGEVAALTAAVCALKAGATGIAIMDPVTVFKGADLSDVPPDRRMFLLSRIAQQEADKWRTDLDALKLELAFARKGQEMARLTAKSTRGGLLDVSSRHHFDEHTAKAWKFVAERNIARQSAGEPPFMYQYNEFAAQVAADADGGIKPLLLDNTDRMALPAAEAAFWHKGWAADEVYTDSDSLSIDDRIAAVDKVEPREHGFFARSKKDSKVMEYHYPQPNHPNRSIINAMVNRPANCLPLLKGIVHYPILHNGQLLTQPGYHKDSGLFLDLGGIDIQPMTAAEGVAVWQDLTVDFCFEGDADFAGVLAYALTPLIHNTVETAPAAVFNKTQPRTGATLLSQIVAIAVTGKDPAFITYTDNEDELEKKLCSALLAGNALCRMDNVAIPIKSAHFHAVLTAPVVQFRLLGTNRYISCDASNTTWALTGNSIQMGKEMLERSHLITLNAQTDNPGKRTGPSTGKRRNESSWKYPQIVQFARDNRPRLLSALCAILHGWIDAGRPAPSNPPALGGFEGWINTIGGILESAGVPGFMLNRQKFEVSAGGEHQAILNFVELWWDKWNDAGKKAGELRTFAFGLEDGEEELIDPHSIPTARGGLPGARGFAAWLDKNVAGQYFPAGELILYCAKLPMKPSPLYRLEPTGGQFFGMGDGPGDGSLSKDHPEGISDVSDVSDVHLTPCENSTPQSGDFSETPGRGCHNANIANNAKCAISGGSYPIGADGYCEPCRSIGGKPCKAL